MFLRYLLCVVLWFVNTKAIDWQYHMPTPSITVYNPRGLRISIPDSRDINLVVFYVNVTKNLTHPQTGYTEYIVKKVNGKWVFDNSEIALKKGDIIYYKVYVQAHRKGYLYNGVPYPVEELEQNQTSQVSPQQVDALCKDCVPVQTTPTSPTTVQNNSSHSNFTLSACQEALNVVIRLLGETQQELKNAKEDLELLKEIASEQPQYLRLRGNPTHVGEPKELVRYVLFEKLNTNLKIKDAWRNGTVITFELFSLEHKLDVLKRVKKYLYNSDNINISNN